MLTRTELLLVRHGEGVCDRHGVVGGPATCTGLTAQGRAQMLALADVLGAMEAPADVLFTCPRLRVRQSADILGERLGLEPIVLDDLRGVEHGDADGRLWEEVEGIGAGLRHRPDHPHAFGAEPWARYLGRVVQSLGRLVAENHGRRVLLVGHGETVVAANALFLELPVDLSRRAGFTVDHSALTWWQQRIDRFGHATWMLARHNDTSHLVPGQG